MIVVALATTTVFSAPSGSSTAWISPHTSPLPPGCGDVATLSVQIPETTCRACCMSPAVPRRHLLAAGACHMRAPAQHEFHMDSCCLPEMGPATARTAARVQHGATTPSVGSWSPSYEGSSTTRVSYGLVLLAWDGSSNRTDCGYSAR